jgi:hypothetical protein
VTLAIESGELPPFSESRFELPIDRLRHGAFFGLRFPPYLVRAVEITKGGKAMHPSHHFRRGARGVLLILVSAAAVAVLGCDNDVNFQPSLGTFPDFTPVNSARSVEISGRLTTTEGSCLEATVLYDGVEIAEARSQCPNPRGCGEMELTAVTSTSPGHHTISFQVLRQSPEAVRYSADGSVQVARENLSMTFTIPLERKTSMLRARESVSYDVQFWN